MSARSDGANVWLALAEAPVDPRWTFILDVPADTVIKPDEDGGLALLDATGQVRALIAAPYAVDSTPDERTGSGRMTTKLHYELGTAADGRPTLTTVLDDADWLAKAVYPIYVDPSTTLVGPGSDTYGDTFINAGNPTQNYANYQRPDSPTFYEMWLGESPSDSTYKNTALIKFDISSILGYAIDAAELRIRPYHAYYDAPTARGVWAYRIGSTWTESGVKWSTKPSWTTTSTTTTCAEATTLSCVLDASYWTRVWVNGLETNYGLAIDTDGNNATYWKRLIAAEEVHSTSPRLYVTYHDPVTAVSPTGAVKVGSRTLAWTYDNAAAGAAQGKYRVEVSSDNFASTLVTSGDVTTLPAADDATWAIPTGTSLTAGTTYQWRVKVGIGSVATWSPWATGSFIWDPAANLGLQPQHTFESWDLGASDNLAVNVATGNLVVSHPIADLPIQGSSIGIDLTYNRLDPADVGMAPGWRLNVLRRLTINADSTITFTDGTGARHTFINPVGAPVTTYTRPATLYATLVKDPNLTANEFVLTYRDGSKDKFDISGSSGLLVREEDRFANGVTLVYTSGNLTSITDTAGSRSIALGWTSGNLTSITDWVNVAGGIVQTSGSGSRATRFFYSGGQLIGWADPLNTSGSCPTSGSHLTCLTYTNGGLTAIGKTQSYETFSAGTLGSSTRAISTTVTYAGSDVDTITDAEGAATTFRHPAAWATKVTRPGTPASETTYTRHGVVDDEYGRIGSVKRKLGSAQIEQTTTYDMAYPIEPATVTDNVGGGALQRSTTTTYVASSLGLVARIDAPLDGTYRHYTDFTYNANNDVTQTIASRQGDATLRTTTRYCYNSSTCNTSDADPKLYRVISNYVNETAGGTNGQVEDVTVTYQVDSYGQRTRETRSNYSGSTLLDSAPTGWTYDAFGNQTAEIRNYVSGTVTTPGDDITPNATTNARTDLTTTFGYDTAGNRVSTADPRRAIETAIGASLTADDYVSRTVYDALNESVIEQLPTTPGGGDCTPASATCRQASTTYDEIGLVREARDIPDVVTATAFDKVGRSTATYEDPPPAGSAAQTSAMTYDASGRVLTAKDREQVKAGSTLGATVYAYDELGRQTDVTEASGSSPNVASTTHTTYDNLDRTLTTETGFGSAPDIGQTTTTTYDIGDRIIKTDDEFTCASTTYDWRGLAQTTIEGQTSGTCTGPGSRTTTNTYDTLGRLTQSSVTGGDILAAPTYDAAGRQLSTSSTTAGTTTASTTGLNPLDQVIAETRSDGGTATSWTRVNYDAAGNPTDRCVWNATPTELCKTVGTAMSPEPAVRTTTAYDARNNRVSLKTPGAGETTYDSAHNYAIDKTYTPTKLNGSGQVTAEHLTDYGYDSRHRLISIDESVCPVTAGTHSCTSTAVLTGSDDYTYDDNDNRTQVVESKDGGTAVTTTYCYDALNRLIAAKLTTACTSSPTEAYTYDVAGNRTKTVISGTTTWFGHNTKGQLCKTGGTSGTDCASANIAYDATGRTQAWNGWTFTYDGDGRLASACKVDGCATNDKVTMRYDGEGRRIELVVRSGATTTTTTFRYQGDTIAQELTDTGSGATVTREYVVDERGAIVQVCDPSCISPTKTHLVTYNGHGDALALWQINADGTLTLANSYTYDTWGRPTVRDGTGTVLAWSDSTNLRFRFLYVGAQDVQWDDLGVGLGLIYMHARHYSPALARFLQPDPSAAEANLYAYAGNACPSATDPTGLAFAAWNEPKCEDLLFRIWRAYRTVRQRWTEQRAGRPSEARGHARAIGSSLRTLSELILQWDRSGCGPRYKMSGDLPYAARRIGTLQRNIPAPRLDPDSARAVGFWATVFGVSAYSLKRLLGSRGGFGGMGMGGGMRALLR